MEGCGAGMFDSHNGVGGEVGAGRRRRNEKEGGEESEEEEEEEGGGHFEEGDSFHQPPRGSGLNPLGIFCCW